MPSFAPLVSLAEDCAGKVGDMPKESRTLEIGIGDIEKGVAEDVVVVCIDMT